MNLRDLEYLVAVGDHHHFGNAADACLVSQPTLSTQLKKLEQELGISLIERSPRHVMLTAAGERVVERARTILDQAAAIRVIARQATDPEGGTLRLGLFPTLAPYLLPHVVPAIHERYPQMELLLIEEKTEVVLEMLRAGRLDVGILAQPIHGEHLQQQPLFTEDFVLAVPADHPLAVAGGPVDPSVLAGEQVLLLEEGHCLRDQALSVCRLTGASERRGFRATSLETLRQMVAAGVGITLLPELAVQPPVPRSDDIVLLRFSDPVPQREIAMVWRSTSVFQELLPDMGDLIASLAANVMATHPPSP